MHGQVPVRSGFEGDDCANASVPKSNGHLSVVATPASAFGKCIGAGFEEAREVKTLARRLLGERSMCARRVCLLRWSGDTAGVGGKPCDVATPRVI